jgi:peptidoglycan/LPS O-acetylase OafA/YrhL
MTTDALKVHRSAPKVSTRQTFRPDVQGLRAVAVGLVVLDHAGVQAVAGGYVGVDVFFVISGFLITGLLLADAAGNGRVSFATFYTRRALRILPAATVVIVTTMLVSVQVLDFLRAKEVLTDSIWATLFAANVRFGLQNTDYFAADQWLSPLQHFWSLAVEEQFYVVWPALLALVLFGVRGLMPQGRGGKSRPHRTLFRGRVVLVLVAVGAGSLYFSVIQTASIPTLAYFSTFTRAWELVAGALLATLLPALQRLPGTLRAALSWAGVVGIAVAALTFDVSTPFPGSAALLPVLSACAVIAGGVGAPRFGAWMLLSTRPLTFIGDISYSLYLWHWPVLILGAAYVGHALSFGQALALVGAAVLLSVASYFGVENPFRRSKRIRAWRPHSGMLLYPIAVVSVLLVAQIAQPASPFAAAGSQGHRPRFAGDALTAVRTSVTEAQRADPIPADMSPTIDNVKADLKGIGNCSGSGLRTSNEICQFGDPQGRKRMVIFGNSHSTMWIPALTANAKSAHWQFTPVVKEACGFIDFTAPPDHSTCGSWYQWAKSTIRTLHPDLIVISALVNPGWERGVRQIVDELKGLGTRMLLMSDVPRVDVAPAACLLTKGATQKTCLWTQQDKYLKADATTQSIAHQAKIEFVNVSPWFCHNLSCPTIIDSMVAYADHGHITGTYARYLAPDLAPYLKLT